MKGISFSLSLVADDVKTDPRNVVGTVPVPSACHMIIRESGIRVP